MTSKSFESVVACVHIAVESSFVDLSFCILLVFLTAPVFDSGVEGSFCISYNHAWCSWPGIVWDLSGNELTGNSSGNIRPQLFQLAEPLWTDPGIKNGISVLELMST